MITLKRGRAQVSFSVSLKRRGCWSIYPCIIVIGVRSPSAQRLLINSVRDDFHAVFLIIILKDEQRRNGLDPPVPPGINTFNYIQQMVFGWTWEPSEHVVQLPRGDGRLDARTKRKPYGQKEATESGRYRWWEQDMFQTNLKVHDSQESKETKESIVKCEKNAFLIAIWISDEHCSVFTQ